MRGKIRLWRPGRQQSWVKTRLSLTWRTNHFAWWRWRWLFFTACFIFSVLSIVMWRECVVDIHDLLCESHASRSRHGFRVIAGYRDPWMSLANRHAKIIHHWCCKIHHTLAWNTKSRIWRWPPVPCQCLSLSLPFQQCGISPHNFVCRCTCQQHIFWDENLL